MGIIYKITNIKNEKSYIGQTNRDLKIRLQAHLHNGRNSHIANAIRANGLENFNVEILCSCSTQQELNAKEKEMVIKHNTMYPNGYNHRAGGDQNGICSDELRKKISVGKKGKPVLKRRGEIRTEEQRVKISRGLGCSGVVSVNIKTGKVKYYKTVNSTRKDGFNPSNVSSVCRNKRPQTKGYKFFYLNEYANTEGYLEKF